MSYHHYHQQGLSTLASSVLKYEAIFFFNFLDYVFLSVHCMKISLEFCLMATSVHILANFHPFMYLFILSGQSCNTSHRSILMCRMRISRESTETAETPEVAAQLLTQKY
jgi:hypothetical protein